MCAEFRRPYPIINVIVDEASLSLKDLESLGEARAGERVRARRAHAKGKQREKDAAAALDGEMQRLARLESLRDSALIRRGV